MDNVDKRLSCVSLQGHQNSFLERYWSATQTVASVSVESISRSVRIVRRDYAVSVVRTRELRAKPPFCVSKKTSTCKHEMFYLNRFFVDRHEESCMEEEDWFYQPIFFKYPNTYSWKALKASVMKQWMEQCGIKGAARSDLRIGKTRWILLKKLNNLKRSD